jgi:hypothetical protein
MSSHRRAALAVFALDSAVRPAQTSGEGLAKLAEHFRSTVPRHQGFIREALGLSKLLLCLDELRFQIFGRI